MQVAWTREEISELHSLFKEYISSHQTPGMKECLKAKEKSKEAGGSLYLRHWETIKKKYRI